VALGPKSNPFFLMQGEPWGFRERPFARIRRAGRRRALCSSAEIDVFAIPQARDLRFVSLLAITGFSLSAARLQAQQAQQSRSAPDLAQALLNPATNLINVSFEHNFEFSQDSAHTVTYTGNMMPVVPFRLDKTWSLITRTLVPFISTRSLDTGGDRTLGVGDIVETVYLSRERASSGWFWGAGPTMVFPTSTNRSLGRGKWSAGPSVGVLRQEGPWTFTLLTAQVWSFAGDPGRPRVSTAFVESIAAYTTSKGTSLGVDTQLLYDWTAGQWTVPVELSAAHIVTIGRRPLSIGLAGRYGLAHPEDGPAWGLMLALALLFPR
jgi:hypothetical protein